MSENISNKSRDTVRPTRIRYVVLVLLASAAGSAYVTRYCLSTANKTIQDDLPWFGDTEFGYLMSAFSTGYLLFQVPGGWMGQRFGTRIVAPCLSVIWSVFTVVTAMVSTLWAMIVSRFTFGLAQGGLIPNLSKVVKDWFPGSIRGRVSSVVAGSMSLGGACTMMVTGVLLVHFHWRAIFIGYSAVGIIWAAVFYWYFRTRPEEHAKVNEAELELVRGEDETTEEDEAQKMSWAAAFRSLNAWMLCGQLFFKAAGYLFFVTFFTSFLQQRYNIKVDKAGFLNALPLLAVAAGTIPGGAIVDWLLKRTGSRWVSRCGWAAGALMLSCAAVYATTFTNNETQFTLVIAVAAFCSGLAMPCPWAAVVDMGGRNAALVMGMMNSAGCLAGIIVPPIKGMLIDHIKNTNGDWNQVIYLQAAFYFAASVCWLFVNPNKLIGQSEPATKSDV